MVALITLGVLFRVVNLDQKPYWFNETITSLRISGYDEHRHVNSQLYTGRLVSLDDLQKYQTPNSEKTVIDTIRNLANKDPQHPPLYFVLARLWTQSLGYSVSCIRSLSVLFSLLVLPAIYWLAQELFQSPAVSKIAVTLTALSPVLIRYSQEARPYSLWTVMIVLSCAALLRALRVNTRSAWAFYSATLVVSLYTQLFSTLVIISHAIYVFAIKGIRRHPVVLSYVVASLVSLLLFTPWLRYLMLNMDKAIETTNHLRSSPDFLRLLEAWGLNISHLFISWSQEAPPAFIYLSVPVALLTGYAVCFLCQHVPRRIWLFVLLLALINTLALVLPDVFIGGLRSTRARYFFPTYISLLLAISYALATYLPSKLIKLRDGLRLAGCVTLFALCVGSSAFNAQAATWWGLSQVDIDIAQILNQQQHPLVISELPYGVIAPLSYQLHSNVYFALIKNPENLAIPDIFCDVFLYNPSEQLKLKLLEHQQKLDLIYQKPRTDAALYSLYRVRTVCDSQ